MDGLLLLDKPEGPTSHDMVARVRRATRQRRVGHAGTLDPLASGLLPLVLGRATRLVRFLPQSPKRYHGTLRLGLATATDDVTGEVIARHDGPLPAAERVIEAARAFRGHLMQRPPAFSARKVDGQRLYRLARRGVEVEAPEKPAEVSCFDLRPAERAGDFCFVAEVSAGTYIRSLARDLGRELGCGGTLVELRRVAIGPLSVEDALGPDVLETPDPTALREALIPLDRMPLTPPAVRLTGPEEARGFSAGVAVAAGIEGPEGLCRVLAPDGRLLGIAEAGEGRLQPRVVLPPPRTG
jgi:tRNA pseudouridine55 synthase